MRSEVTMLVIYFFIVLVLTAACFFIGNYFLVKNCFADINLNRIGLGYLIIMGLFSIISIPFMFFHTKFSWLYWTILFLTAALSFVSIKFFLVENLKNRGLFIDKFRNFVRQRNVIFYSCIFLIFLQMVLFVILKNTNDDDGWYVAVTSTALENDEIFSRDPATGSTLFPFQTHYELVGHELFLAVICRLFSINPPVLCHTVIPVFFLLIHYVVVYDLCRKMDKENSDRFFLCFILLNVFSGYCRFSRGGFMFRRIWCGKTLIASISLPLLLLLWWNIYERKQVKKGDIILLTLATYFSFHLSAIGLYMIPLAYMVYTIVFFIYTRKWFETIKLCLPMVFALPYVFLKWTMMTSEDLALVKLDADKLEWLSVLDKTSNGKVYIWVLWAVAVLILLKTGRGVMKYLLGIYPVLCFVTFLNPLLCGVFAKYITGTSVYWRLIWNLQMSFTIIGALICVYKYWKWNKASFMIFYFMLLIIFGDVIYFEEKYPLAENYENIEPTTINLADVMVEENYLEGGIMIPFPYSYEIRQYTGKIMVTWTEYENRHYTPDKFERLSSLYDKLYNVREYSSDIVDDLREYNVAYLGLYTEMDNSAFSGKYDCIYHDEELTVYDIASAIN